jgi:osmotically-inducible protein OsmY
MKLILPGLLLLAAVGCKTNADADAPPAADNTAHNERDRDNAAAKTPGDQSENAADRTISQQARQGVVDNDDVSTTGKNVKIITADGVVTLRGPVKSLEEKATIASIVKKVDGVKRVENQLEVAAN